MRVRVDLELCQGHGLCADDCPEVFDVEERPGRYPQVKILQEHPPESLREKVVRAVTYCPTHALKVETD